MYMYIYVCMYMYTCISHLQVEGIKMIVRDSEFLPHNRTSFIRSMGGLVELTTERTTSLQSVAERISDLKVSSVLRVCLSLSATAVPCPPPASFVSAGSHCDGDGDGGEREPIPGGGG